MALFLALAFSVGEEAVGAAGGFSDEDFEADITDEDGSQGDGGEFVGPPEVGNKLQRSEILRGKSPGLAWRFVRRRWRR